MMENESVNDIIAEIRAYGAQPPPRLMWLEIADRIEAAWERERQPLTIAEWIDKTETVADIAAVLRRYVLPSLADRLEAAAKRERAKIEADALAVGGIVESARQKPVGNAAAMREALEFIKLASDDYETYGTTKAGALDVIYDKACAALAKPARICDVLPWRAAWDEWRTKHHPQKPQTYKESYESSVAFLEWFTTSATEEGGDDGNDK